MFALVSLFPTDCVGIFVKDQAAIEQGVQYLNIVRFTYPFFVITAILLGSMRSVETVRLALIVSSISLVVNCSINFLLITVPAGSTRRKWVSGALPSAR